MLSSLDWLALEVKYLGPARAFYEGHLDLPVDRESAGAVVYDVGETDLVLREPGPVPRGGLHTHFAFEIPAGEYDDWWDRLDDDFDLVEFEFGHARSLYCYDPDGNCVELGQADVEGPGVSGIFETVLEVEDLERAESFYRAIGFEVMDRGDVRRRVRLTGPVDLELWEPQLGIADARGGVHVDFAVGAEDPAGAVDAVADRALSVTDVDGGVRVRDPDGHYLTVNET